MFNFIIGMFIGMFIGAFLATAMMAMFFVAKKSDKEGDEGDR